MGSGERMPTRPRMLLPSRSGGLVSAVPCSATELPLLKHLNGRAGLLLMGKPLHSTSYYPTCIKHAAE